LHTSEGSSPDRELFAKESNVKYVRLANPRGKGPDSLFEKSDRYLMLVKFVKVAGMEPEILFWDKDKM
jgi:hypothetical protein